MWTAGQQHRSEKRTNSHCKPGHDLAGWWCNEDGIPEEDRNVCGSTATAEFKEKGDWCEEHNRAESQCDPSRAEQFAKLYEAKSGTKPAEPLKLSVPVTFVKPKSIEVAFPDVSSTSG